MGCTKAKRRRQEKISTVAGVVPTVPTVADHCTNGWLVTDIYKGEIFINTADNKAYTRGDAGIFEIGGAQTLSVTGNTLSISGGNSVAYEPYLVYTALLSQSGTDAPLATVLRNTLGMTVSWSYSSSGNYLATLSNTFVLDKTSVFIGSERNNVSDLIRTEKISTNEIEVRTMDGAQNITDGILLSTTIEIRIYP